MALCLGLSGWAGTRKVKPIWILLKQETVSGSGIRWAICKYAPRSRQITTPVPHHSVFTGRMPFLSPNQQSQSTEDSLIKVNYNWHCPHSMQSRICVMVHCLSVCLSICPSIGREAALTQSTDNWGVAGCGRIIVLSIKYRHAMFAAFGRCWTQTCS